MSVNTDTFSAPFGQQSRSLIIDLVANLASARMLRNVLKVRNIVTSSLSIMRNEVITLPQVASTAAPSQVVISPETQTSGMVLSSDTPVRLILVNNAGTLDLGQNTMAVLTSGIVSLTIINDQNLNAANVNLILV